MTEKDLTFKTFELKQKGEEEHKDWCPHVGDVIYTFPESSGLVFKGRYCKCDRQGCWHFDQPDVWQTCISAANMKRLEEWIKNEKKENNSS